MAFAETAPLIAQLDLKGNFTSNLKKAQGQLGSFSKSLGQTGKGIGQLGAGFARVGAIGATAVIGGLTGAAKAAIDFEDAFAGVRKTVDEADLRAAGLSFESLAKDFREMATEIPIAATEFARLGEAAGALGVRAQDIDDFAKTAALLGVTTDLTADAAADALGRIGTILGFTGKQYEEFADILVNLGNTGASTESEIIEVTKRFALAGKAAGLSTPQIAAFASAIASAGVEPEAAGSSLSRLFDSIVNNTANATTEAKTFAKVAGLSFEQFSKLVKDDTVGAMTLFLDNLKELDKFEASRALADVGITNVRDRNAIRALAETYDKNLVPALKNAEEATGSLSEEARKRFDTIASKLILLKNNFIEAGITIGEGFLPALGRATEKLIAFLKVDANKAALKGLGEDIGKSLDSINWDSVLANTRSFVGILKDAAGVAMDVLSVLNKLPTEIKAAGLGFLALNKLSGGLIGSGVGNILGGLAGTVVRAGASRIPGIGAAFAQPVFVTNWPPGMGLGGPLGALGGPGLLGKVLGLLPATAIAAAIVTAAVPIGEAFAAALPAELKGPGGAGESEAQRRHREYYEQWERDHPMTGPPLPPNYKPAFQGPTQLGPPTPAGMGNTFANAGGRNLMSVTAIDAILMRGKAAGFKPTRAAAEATLTRNLERLAEVQNAKTQAVKDEAARTTAGTLLTAAAVQNMDRQKPPITNVTVINNISAAQTNKAQVIQRRYGPSGGSRERSGPLEH